MRASALALAGAVRLGSRSTRGTELTVTVRAAAAPALWIGMASDEGSALKNAEADLERDHGAIRCKSPFVPSWPFARLFAGMMMPGGRLVPVPFGFEQWLFHDAKPRQIFWSERRWWTEVACSCFQVQMGLVCRHLWSTEMWEYA